MEPKDIINLLESDRVVERKKGLKELYNFFNTRKRSKPGRF